MEKSTKRLLTVLSVMLVLGALAAGGLYVIREKYLYWNGSLFYREARKLDIGGKQLDDLSFLREFPNLEILDVRDTELTTGQYEQLCKDYPRLELIWEVPFQNRYIDSDSTKITLTTLRQEEIGQMDYLTELRSIDAWDCEDYEALWKLQQHRPDCKVFYSVTLAGKEWDCDINILDLADADAEELEKNLRYLPNVRAVYLTGELPQPQTLTELETVYPDIAFFWEAEAFGSVWEKNTKSITLKKGQIQTPVELDQYLSYFPELKTVDLMDCALPQKELMALAHRWPEIDFLFYLQIGHVTVATNAEEIDISNCKFRDVAEVEQYISCFTNLRKVVMCECGIESAQMDALNRRYEDIRFVWSVNLGGILFRTDAVHFTPNRWGLKLKNEDIYELRYCTDMVCVDIGHAEEVTDCEWAAFMPNLKYLILAQTKITDLTPLSGLKNLVFLELFQSSVRDYTPLLGCTALEDINLSYTYGDPTPISQMPWLKRIWWNGWWWAQNVLTQTHPHAQMEFNTVSSTGGAWREGQHYYDMRDFIGMEYMTG